MKLKGYKCDICNKKFTDGRALYMTAVSKIKPGESEGLFNHKKTKVYICSGCVERVGKLGRMYDVIDKLAADVYGDIDKRVRNLEQHMGLWDDGK